MKVVVGLGNPGREYARTRHNVGFDVLAHLAEACRAEPGWTKFDAEIRETSVADQKLLLVAPQTYMNLSGRSVRRLIDFYKIATEQLLVVCDDLNLDLARLRLRASGSAGGQKGLQNIIDHLGTQNFARLRIGIGRPPGRMAATAYVLQKFSTQQREAVEAAIARAAETVILWTKEGVHAAMNRANAPPSGPVD